MIRRLAVLVVALVALPSVAQTVRLESDADSTAAFDVASGVTFSAGKCGNGVILDSDADVAAWNAQGVTHCDASDVASFSECSSAGDQIDAISIQFWFSCDTDSDGTCDFDPTATTSETLFGRSDGSNTPQLLKYDASTPIETFRFYNSATQFTISGANLYDGAWHKIYISYDIPNNDRKICVDGTCHEDLTSFTAAFASSGTVGWRASGDPDVAPGIYDEIQIVTGYDQTFSSDGPGCGESASVPTYVTGSGHPYGTRVNVSGCSAETEVEVRAEPDASAPLLASLRSTTWTTSLGLVFSDPYEGGGPDFEPDGDTEMSARARCYVSGSPDVWSGWGAVFGGQFPAYLSTYASGQERATWVLYDNFERPDLSGGLEDGTPVLWVGSAACALDLFSGSARLSGTSNCYSYTTDLEDDDAVVVAKVECPGCSAGSSGNTDFVIQVDYRPTAGTMQEYYQAKIEGSGTSSIAAKWNKAHDVDGDGTPDPGEVGAACGTSSDFAASYPMWFKVEVYPDAGNADGKRLRIWSAPDSAGSPGTWTLRSDVVDDPITGTCAGGAWSGTGGILTTPGAVGLGVLKAGDHRYDEIAIGYPLVGLDEPPSRRTP